MNPITVKLSVDDINTILQTMLEAPVPGKMWLNAWYSLKTQRDAALTPAPAEPPKE